MMLSNYLNSTQREVKSGINNIVTILFKQMFKFQNLLFLGTLCTMIILNNKRYCF